MVGKKRRAHKCNHRKPFMLGEEMNIYKIQGDYVIAETIVDAIQKWKRYFNVEADPSSTELIKESVIV